MNGWSFKYPAIALFVSMIILSACGGSGGGGGGTPATVDTTAMKVSDTGQTTKYSTAFGDDSDYTINPPSYTDNGDGTITDNITTLMWQKCSNGQANDASCSGTAGTLTWGSAITYCENLFLATHTDWRLPDPKDLMSIANYGALAPAINRIYFPATVSSYYWSATTSSAFSTSYAWDVYFSNGSVNFNGKSNSFHVRCVRGVESSAQSFTDNGDGTVTDNATTLMWQKCSNLQANDASCSGAAGRLEWEAAITYCESLSLAGYSDWRLPNIKELDSLVDGTVHYPAIDSAYFPATVSLDYWSATTDANFTSGAWIVLFGNGDVIDGFFKSASYNYVRCVR